MSKIGFVYQGGAACAAVGAGAADALVEMGINPAFVDGTSGGSLNTFGFRKRGAAGTVQLWREKVNGKQSVFSGPSWFGGGLANLNPLRKLLKEVDANPTQDCQVPCWVTYTDMNNGELIYHLLGAPLASPLGDVDATVASCSIPFAVKPVAGRYADGGLLANCPLKKAIDEGCDEIYALLSFRLDVPKYEPSWLGGPIDNGLRAIEIMLYNQTKKDVAECDWYNAHDIGRKIKLHIIQPSQKYNRSSSDFSREAIEESLRAGREAAEDYMRIML